MKKLFAMIAIAGLLTACNDDADNTTTEDTSSTTTNTTITTTPDSLNAGGTTDSLSTDSLNRTDSLNK